MVSCSSQEQRVPREEKILTSDTRSPVHGVLAELDVVAVQAVLTGSQEVRVWARGGQAEV